MAVRPEWVAVRSEYAHLSDYTRAFNSLAIIIAMPKNNWFAKVISVFLEKNAFPDFVLEIKRNINEYQKSCS